MIFEAKLLLHFITHHSLAIFHFRTERVQLLCRNSELMRKLRNLWSSHKKYCTTSVPLRSYTPLSGYPHSRSSYDLDRTYYTSTPYTNRFRRPESRYGSDVGELIRDLSDLSIDKIDDSDDDPLKVRLSDVLTLKRIKSMLDSLLVFVVLKVCESMSSM